MVLILVTLIFFLRQKYAGRTPLICSGLAAVPALVGVWYDAKFSFNNSGKLDIGFFISLICIVVLVLLFPLIAIRVDYYTEMGEVG